jgi:hypothetical protein
MKQQSPKSHPNEDDVLRRMLATPPDPKKAKPKRAKKARK